MQFGSVQFSFGVLGSEKKMLVITQKNLWDYTDFQLPAKSELEELSWNYLFLSSWCLEITTKGLANMADNHYSILFLMSYSQVCNDEVLNFDYDYVIHIRITTVVFCAACSFDQIYNQACRLNPILLCLNQDKYRFKS